DLPPDELARVGSHEIGSESSNRCERVEDANRLGLPLEGRRWELGVSEHLLGGLERRHADGNAAFWGNRLDPGRGVDRVPGEERLARAGRDAKADEHLAGVYPDPEAERGPARGP